MAVDLSIVVPVFNEAGNVQPLVNEVIAAFQTELRTYELVFVDDASTDTTWERIQDACRTDARVRGLRHTRNSGQSAAIWSGILESHAPLIATLDGDLQNDPADLPRLLAELQDCDFVCGVRVNRRDNFIRRASSKIARWARKKALGVDFRDSACSLRVFKRSALDSVFPFNGWHRFLPILAHLGGATTREIPVNHRARVAGISKYGIGNRLGRGILDLCAIAWYQNRRLRPVPVTKFPES